VHGIGCLQLLTCGRDAFGLIVRDYDALSTILRLHDVLPTFGADAVAAPGLGMGGRLEQELKKSARSYPCVA